MYVHCFRIDHSDFPEGAVSPCCDSMLVPSVQGLEAAASKSHFVSTKYLVRHTGHRVSSFCDGFPCGLETQHIHFTQRKVQSKSMNTWDSDHAFTQRYVHVKFFLGQWIKMTLCTYFVHVCSLLSIQTQPGLMIYCIGPRVLLQLWFSLILGVLGRRPHP